MCVEASPFGTGVAPNDVLLPLRVTIFILPKCGVTDASHVLATDGLSSRICNGEINVNIQSPGPVSRCAALICAGATRFVPCSWHGCRPGLAGMNVGGISQARAPRLKAKSLKLSRRSPSPMLSTTSRCGRVRQGEDTEAPDSEDELETPHITPVIRSSASSAFGEEGSHHVKPHVTRRKALDSLSLPTAISSRTPCRRERHRGFRDLGRWQDRAGDDCRNR